MKITSTEKPKGYFSKSTFKEDSVEFCCEELEGSWNEGFVGFGEKEETALNIVNRPCIYKCSPYPEGAVWDQQAISFCPFCGTAIQISTVKP